MASKRKASTTIVFIVTVGLRTKIKNLHRETGLDLHITNKHDIFFCHFFYRLSALQILGLKDKYIQYIQGALH